MEGFGSSANCDYKTRVAEIAAAGNKSQDWKKYVDDVKSEVQLWDEYRRNRIIMYIYSNAFKVISESDKSLSHAQLLIEYAELKSLLDHNAAVKLLAYGRKILPHFAILYVASAKLELKKGTKEKAFRILKKGSLIGAEPICVITSALHKLIDGKQDHITDSDITDNTLSLRNGKEVTADLTDTLSEMMPPLPGSKSSTQEVQHDLNILASLSAATLSISDQKQAQYQHFNSPPDDSSSQVSNSMHSPEPPALLLWKYSNRKDSVRQSLGNSHSNIPETPQGHHLLAGRNEFSVSKKTMVHFSSTPNMRQPLSSVVGSVSKFRPLGPPRRVKVDPALRRMGEEEEEEPFDSFHKEHKGQIQEESVSTTLKDISNTRCANEDLSHSTSRMHLLSTNLSSSMEVSPAYGFPPVSQNQFTHSTLSSNKTYDLPKMIEKVQPSAHLDISRKLQMSLTDGLNRDTNSMSQQTDAQSASICHPASKAIVPEQDIGNESTKEMLAKQQMMLKQQQQQLVQQQPQQLVQQQPQQLIQQQPQQLIQQQSVQQHPQQLVPQQLVQQQSQQLVPQQLIQQQSQQAGVCNRTFSVSNMPPTANEISLAKSNMPSGKKTIFVNGKPYGVVALIGRGGSSKVYRVVDSNWEFLALKCVNLACANQVIVQGYMNEINLLRKLQHCDRVIKLYDFEYIEANKKLLIVLEYGQLDLCQFISQNDGNTQIDLITIRYLWLQMVRAVHAMHKEGVIHSDLKPANFIMVSGKVKLIDFGIANSLQQDNTSVFRENMVGTPSYMSPEALIAINTNPSDTKPQYKVGIRSDVWSLGCILYQMVYGHTPFQHIRQKLEAIVNPGHEIAFPDISDSALLDVLKKCLTRDIYVRPTTDEILDHDFMKK